MLFTTMFPLRLFVVLHGLRIMFVYSTCGIRSYQYVGQINTVGSTNVLKNKFNIISRSECAIICYHDSVCVAFSYNHFDQQCLTHSAGPESLNYTTGPNWVMYRTPEQDDVIERWASAVLNFSSEYTWAGPSDYRAFQILGVNDTYPRYGDIPTAWSQNASDAYPGATQWIEVAIPDNVYVMAVHIYETLNAGGVYRVSLRTLNNTWVTVWQTSEVEVLNKSRIFSPAFDTTSFLCDGVRLDVNISFTYGYVNIDAIKVVGKRETV